ncbi:malto-oligosyltrehalose trehalohydrolase [Ramlibacter sp. Leaf400]|uniref:malto-oligosyltrehalose trehalohydrolase n=1 Tax=Ramlibacter sp. Leaf400 TaxID=1736365 RepID=UPI0006F3A379|nr:malto-oligosyltrehalose trehalohydrolase [Ramlibacter sp. Leaf400]KQT11011.1 malto-oligosyltrehalose trehalohydrolase [Ramlibacter sp. Leaf400]
MRCAHAMRFGASLRPEGGVDFRLWGPGAKRAELALHEKPGATPRLLPARRDEQGWWECHVPEAGAGTLYQWRIDGEQSVPDPASRHNPDGVHEPSAVVDPLAFQWDDDWTGRPWHEVVLYELHVGAFTPEGTFAAAQGRLPQLAQLGITAVELMPLADFPGRFGWGYDGVLPFAPHAAYGTPDQLKAFIQAAHRLGLMVFLDVVYNHFGPDGNYLHRYAPGFFSRTRSSPWGAAINFDGPDSRPVRDFFIDNAVYWTTEYRFDGLRLDAVHAIADDSRPHVLEELSTRVRESTRGRHVHLVLENENNHHERLATRPEPGRYDGQWNDDFHHALHVALTGETSGYYHDYGHAAAEAPLQLLARSLSHGMLFEDSARKPGGAREAPRPTPPVPLSALVNFAHNHDQVGNRAFGERLAALVGPDAAPLATLLALLTPAVPMLFLGEEFGSTRPWLYFADWQGELKKAVQEGRKREFGHVNKVVDGKPLPLPDPCSADTFDASRPGDDERDGERGRAWQAMVRSALAARWQWIVPRQEQLLTGQHTAQRVGETGLAVQWRYGDGQVLSLEINLGPAPLAVPDKHVGPVEPQDVFLHRWPADAAPGTWPAWAARWRIGTEITQ